MVLKLISACLLCIGLVSGIVFIVKRLFPGTAFGFIDGGENDEKKHGSS